MIEQITTTQVGLLGMVGVLLSVAVGFVLHAWILNEVRKGDEDPDG